MHIQGCSSTKGDMSDMPSVRAPHRAATHLPAGIEGVRTYAPTSLLRMCAGVDDVSKLEKLFKLPS